MSGASENSAVSDARPATDSAALEVLAGDRWQSQYRLEPGRRVLIGRDETNHFRVNDDSCSRTHCKVFQTGDRWILRDADSRNGTFVDGQPINGDYLLEDGMVFEIGKTRLRFVESELSNVDDERFAATLSPRDTSEFPSGNGELLRAARKSVFHDVDSATVPRDASIQAMLADLYRIASMIASATTIRGLCETALEAALRHTSADFGGVLLLPSTQAQHCRPEQLELRAFRASADVPYARVSEAISRFIFDVGHGVHWQTVESGDSISTADSVNELEVKSAACIPIKFDDRIAGLMHLYSKDSATPITNFDFEFLLAMGEQISSTLRLLVRSKKLDEKLKKAEAIAQTLRDQHRDQTEIVGDSPAIRTLRARIERIAPTDATVLIRGESGVGKELVAQAMHYASTRSNGPFVCMNCAALTESLLESELFGHEKGSFTGATGKKIGKFEQAHGGTLLLDEVGEMSPAIQAKFLRVLEGHAFERVGGSAQIRTNVRVVAATNRDLEDAVRDGTFRRDLYFRLQVMPIDIPPLRERVGDVPRLAQHFVEKFRAKLGRHVKGLSADAAVKLSGYHWPGNIRELQNTIERAVILANNDTITSTDISLSPLESEIAGGQEGSLVEDHESPQAFEFAERTIEEVERGHILRTVEHFDWNKTKAAQTLGIERSTLDRKLKRYGVSRPDSD